MKFAAVAAVSAAVLFASPALAEDLHFQIHNNTNQTITEIYVSKVSTNSWESNILDGQVESGGDVNVSIQDGETVCHYDVKVVFESAQKIYPNQNLCQLDGGAYNVL
ncbi:MAG: hypothetical protein ISS15_07780 [Alphaproteobacteria bacterium]|nr:hypothetical protein [Alphaproteobacteria bacterium]MBL6936770.1 hypothetical protein [Alphaproteobacteria bacterium]MBL7097539.1 hypothetical protein [Alphaproteobacteria bacterium]